jgi:hypothetical protein
LSKVRWCSKAGWHVYMYDALLLHVWNGVQVVPDRGRKNRVDKVNPGRYRAVWLQRLSHVFQGKCSFWYWVIRLFVVVVGIVVDCGGL